MSKHSLDRAGKLQDLRDHFGLAVTEERYDERNFGDAYVVLTAADFAMRIVRERGQVFTDLALPGQKWVDVDKKVTSLGMHPKPESVLSLDQLMDILRRDKDRLLRSL